MADILSAFENIEPVEVFALVMFFIGFYGLITSRKIIKSIVFLVLVEVSIIMFFLSIGFHRLLVPPVAIDMSEIALVADPLPQALMITAVIVGLATTAINITMFITLFRKYNSADWDFVKSANSQPQDDTDNANTIEKEREE